MTKEHVLAKRLLNAVWNEDVELAGIVLDAGADANWYFNGYPILLHAVFTRNEEMVMLLLEYGAQQASEALGFALDRGIGEMVRPLAFLGIVPKKEHVLKKYGEFPQRYAPII
ncbi:hypothetical protein [Amedibacillus dolichus]|uniref:hypothetical protein n=1 Tax=Amedibacillus dolichus TaxID=31971 RepID=UPI00242E3162|nr:hypothetical protein [Amedibacillus dolichus]